MNETAIIIIAIKFCENALVPFDGFVHLVLLTYNQLVTYSGTEPYSLVISQFNFDTLGKNSRLQFGSNNAQREEGGADIIINPVHSKIDVLEDTRIATHNCKPTADNGATLKFTLQPRKIQLS